MAAYPTRLVNNAFQPLTDPDGTVLTGIEITFTLVDRRGVETSVIDVETESFVAGRVKVVVDLAGFFSVALWPNDRGNIQTLYRVDIDHPYYESFMGALPEGDLSDLDWITFKLSGQPLTTVELTGLLAHIAAADPHPQYALLDGTKPFTGSIKAGAGILVQGGEITLNPGLGITMAGGSGTLDVGPTIVRSNLTIHGSTQFLGTIFGAVTFSDPVEFLSTITLPSLHTIGPISTDEGFTAASLSVFNGAIEANSGLTVDGFLTLTGGDAVFSGSLTLTFGSGGLSVLDGGILANGDTILNAATSNSLVVQYSDDSLSEGPRLLLNRISLSPAANDKLGIVDFSGAVVGTSNKPYAHIVAIMDDPALATRTGHLEIATSLSGSSPTNRLLIGPGITTAGVTGGDKGAGTINAGNMFINGNPVVREDASGDVTLNGFLLTHADGLSTVSGNLRFGTAGGGPGTPSWVLSTAGVIRSNAVSVSPAASDGQLNAMELYENGVRVVTKDAESITIAGVLNAHGVTVNNVTFPKATVGPAEAFILNYNDASDYRGLQFLGTDISGGLPGSAAVLFYMRRGLFSFGVTGGDKGPGSINAGSIFVGGNPVVAEDASGNVDVTNHLAVGPGAVAQATIPVYVRGSGTNAAMLMLDRIDDGATGGVIVTRHITASPAVNDLVGRLAMQGNDTGGTVRTYGTFDTQLSVTTLGAESAVLRFLTRRAGTDAVRVRIGDGMWMEGATSTDKGAGTFNAVAVYDDGAGPLTDYVLDFALDGEIDFGLYDTVLFGGAKARAWDPDELDISYYEAKWRARRALPPFLSRDQRFLPTKEVRQSIGEQVQALIETVEVNAVHVAGLHARLRALEEKANA